MIMRMVQYCMSITTLGEIFALLYPVLASCLDQEDFAVSVSIVSSQIELLQRLIMSFTAVWFYSRYGYI